VNLRYYRWDAETYLAFHAVRTLVSIRCSRVGGPEREELVFSTRLIRLRLTKYLRWEAVRAAVRLFLYRYRKAIVRKKKWWFAIDCNKFVQIELKYDHKHVASAERRGAKKVNEFLKSVIEELLREMF